VLVGLVGLIVFTDLPGGSPGATTRPSLGLGSPSASASGELPSGSPGTSSEPSASVEPSASASTGPSASPTNQPTAAQNRITFTGVKLDARSDPAGKARTFTFRTDGPGSVSAKLVAKSPQGTTRFCLKVGATGTPLCRIWAAGTLTGLTSAKGKTTFSVTAIGQGIATPTVDVQLTFRALAPSVTVTNARFDGTDSSDYNGLNGQLKVKAAGSISVKASWGGHPFDYTYSLVDLTDPTGGGVFNGNGVGLERTDTATTDHQMAFSLVNSDSGFGITPLTMTISWK
jgi:hypothetical protein